MNKKEKGIDIINKKMENINKNHNSKKKHYHKIKNKI